MDAVVEKVPEMEVKEVTPELEALEVKLRERLEVEYQKSLEVKIKEISDKMTEENKKLVQDAIEKFRKDMLPPGPEDIKKLLEQEYAEFTIEIPIGRGNSRTKKTFTICELPQAVEKKMFKKVKEIVVPLSTEFAQITVNLLEGEAGKKIVQLMNTFEPVLDLMAGIAAISLNPYGEEEEVTEEWVAGNISSTRIAKIVTAQMECNKVRDFLSLVFRGAQLRM